MSGIAIEAATSHVEVLVCADDGRTLAHEVEEVGHGHTQRLTPLVSRALGRAGVSPSALAWVAADLGPGSFTGVRVGLATARGLTLASRARLVGASSLASLAHGVSARRALLVPMVPGGRVDAYSGFFRTDADGRVHALAAPTIGPLGQTLEAIHEARRISGLGTVRCLGPGAARWQHELEAEFPACTHGQRRFGGLSAEDLAHAAHATAGPGGGLLAVGAEPLPVYVRSAQAEERVRHQALASRPLTLRGFEESDVPEVVAIEQLVFSDPWTAEFFLGELRQPLVHARVAERERRIVGYSLAWIGAGSGHLGNIAVVAAERRLGVARRLLDDLLAAARVQKVESLTLEVRVSNHPAQKLYRALGFRLAGLRRGYYRDTGEDALIMEWRPSDVA